MGRTEEGDGGVQPGKGLLREGGGGDDTPARYVASLDVGTTTVRCHVYDQHLRIKGAAYAKVELLHPQPGWVEIEPESLWETVLEVINGAIKNGGLRAGDVTCLGISTQRCSFITWNHESGKYYHNLIAWSDMRADSLVNRWNSSVTLRGLRFGAKLLHMVTQQKRFLVASVLRLMNPQVLSRLLWALDNVPNLRPDAEQGLVRFGTLDTWLIHRLTGGELHVTDFSNASATALFDPFLMQWSQLAWKVFGVPLAMLPEVRDSAGDFGTCKTSLFGAPLPIKALVADQSASMFGSCCFDKGDVKITLGTGTFLNVNTGREPHASVKGLYPVVGWKIRDEVAYLAEGASNDTGSLIEWAQSIGLFKKAEETSDLAQSVPDSGGVCFVPAFSGLQAPYNDMCASAGLIGVTRSSGKEVLVRSLLESIAFRAAQLYQVMLSEASFHFSPVIRTDGGVSANDFVAQLMSNLTNQRVERSASTEMTSAGAALMAGMEGGVWASKEELAKLRRKGKHFDPKLDQQKLSRSAMAHWEKAVRRFLQWHNNENNTQ